MRAIWDSWQNGTKLDFRGDFYQHTLMTPFFDPGPDRQGPPAVFLAAVGEKMTEVAGEVADGMLVHPFTTERYLREVTLPAIEGGLARSRSDPRRLPAVLPAPSWSPAAPRRRMAHGGDRRPAPDRLLRLDPGLPPGARAARVGGPAGRAQPAVQAGQSGRRWAS